MKRLTAFFLLTRPLNVLIAMVSIFIGAFITGTISPLINVLLASLSGGFIAAGANAINDYFDVETDRINKPYRPIAARIITMREGGLFSMVLFSIGVILGLLVNWLAFVVAVFSSMLLYWYSARLKRTVLWGNLSVSLITSLAFIYGGIAVNRLGLALIPAVFSFFYHLGREIIKDAEDIAGDIADRIVTLPIEFGKRKALLLATGIYIFLIGLTIVPYALNIFGIYYLIIVVAIVNAVVVFALFSMWRDMTPNNLSRLSVILKLNMFAGLAAIYCGKF